MWGDGYMPLNQGNNGAINRYGNTVAAIAGYRLTGLRAESPTSLREVCQGHRDAADAREAAFDQISGRH